MTAARVEHFKTTRRSLKGAPPEGCHWIGAIGHDNMDAMGADLLQV
jgi:hypothetical protein